MSTPVSGSGASGEHQTHGDQFLVSRLAAGDSQALALLMSHHWSAVLTYASGFLDTLDAAEDVAQTAFVRLWEGRLRWRHETTPRGLLFRIVRNLALNERRHAGVKAAWHERTALSVDDGGVPQSDEVEADQLRGAAVRAIARLSPRRREVFELARFHGLSHREIAEALGISPQTVANQMSAALTELRDRLAPFLDAAPLAPPRTRSVS
jgi:RNA polymerase sigma-70 factor, ECF subfamily